MVIPKTGKTFYFFLHLAAATTIAAAIANGISDVSTPVDGFPSCSSGSFLFGLKTLPLDVVSEVSLSSVLLYPIALCHIPVSSSSRKSS